MGIVNASNNFILWFVLRSLSVHSCHLLDAACAVNHSALSQMGSVQSWGCPAAGITCYPSSLHLRLTRTFKHFRANSTYAYIHARKSSPVQPVRRALHCFKCFGLTPHNRNQNHVAVMHTDHKTTVRPGET